MPPTGPIPTPGSQPAVPPPPQTAFQTAFEEAVRRGFERTNQLFQQTDHRERTREVFHRCRQRIREQLAALTDRSTQGAVEPFCNFVDRVIEQHFPGDTSFKRDILKIVRDCRNDLQRKMDTAESKDGFTPEMLRRLKGTLQNAAGDLRGEQGIFENGKLEEPAQKALRDTLQCDLYGRDEDDVLFTPPGKDASAIIEALQGKVGNFCEHIRGPLEQDVFTLKGRCMFFRILKRIDDAIIDIQNRVSAARTPKDPNGPLLTLSLPPEILAKLEEGKDERDERDERDEIDEREINEGLYDTVIEHTLQSPFKDLRMFAKTWMEGLGTPLFIEQEDFATICRTFQEMTREGKELIKRRIPLPTNKRGIRELCFGNQDNTLVNEIQRRWLAVFERLKPLFEKGKSGLFEKMKKAFGPHSYIKLYPIFDYTIRKRGKVPSSLVEGVRSFQMDQSLGASFLDKQFAYCQDVAAGRKPREEVFEASPADCLFEPEREYLKLWIRDICRKEKIVMAEALGDFCATGNGNTELEQMADRFNKKYHAGQLVRLGIHLRKLAVLAFVPPASATAPPSVDTPRSPTPAPAPEPAAAPAGPITVREVKPAPQAPAAPAPAPILKPLAALASGEKLPADVEARIATVLDSEPIKVLEHPETAPKGKKYFSTHEKEILAHVRILREHRGTLVLSIVLVVLKRVEEYVKIQRNREPSRAYTTEREWEDTVLRPLDHLTQSADGLPEILQPLALGLQNLDERIAAIESEVTRLGNEAAENETVRSRIEACEREEEKLEADKTAKQGEIRTLTTKLAGVDATSTEFMKIYGEIGECQTALTSLQQRKPEIEARKEKLRRRLKPDVAALHAAKSEELRALLEKKRDIVDQLQRISFES